MKEFSSKCKSKIAYPNLDSARRPLSHDASMLIPLLLHGSVESHPEEVEHSTSNKSLQKVKLGPGRTYHLCAKCSKRVMANSMMCTKCGKWVHDSCAKMERMISTLAEGLFVNYVLIQRKKLWNQVKKCHFLTRLTL